MPSIDAGSEAPQHSFPARAETPRLTANLRSSMGTPMIWGGCGFLLGMVVWHFVGFWSFMTTVVHRGPPPSSAIAAIEQSDRPVRDTKRSAKLSASAPGQASVPGQASAPALASASAVSAQPGCLALALDRRTGIASASPCDPDSPLLQQVASSGRGDRLVTERGSVAGWAASIENLAQGDN